MSFARSSDPLFIRIKRYLPLYALIQLSFLATLVLILLLLRNGLMTHCREDVGNHLDNYLKGKNSSPLVVKKKREGLQGLDFVRLIGDREQFFFSEDPGLMKRVGGLIDLDPQQSSVWISLNDPQREGGWAIVSRELKNGYVVQAGIEYPHLLHLYHRVKKATRYFLVASVVLSCVLTWICHRARVAAVTKAENSLTRIISQKSNSLLLQEEEGELARLYGLLNQLLSQNSQLIKEMQESLDNVAHDLRTPITRLRSVAEYGLQQNSPDKLAEALSDCLEESERVSSMLGIMMSVVEAESGTLQLKREQLQLAGSLEDVLNLYEYVADERNISLGMDVDPTIAIVADKTRITQVWANIVDNGIKYGRSGGAVRLSAEKRGDKVIVTFEDDGMGISENEIHRIWERLFRGDRSRTEQGLGLGLNYVRAVVEAHGGQVNVSSVLGKGSCFTVTLPLYQGDL